MKVILTEEVSNLGSPGDVVEVAPGYARNYLLPRKLAITATSGNVKAMRHHQRVIEVRQKKRAQDAQTLGERIAAIPISITVRAGEAGRLYGSVTAADIAEEIHRLHQVEVDKRKVEIAEPIKVLGEHQVKVRLHREVAVPVNVVVVAAEAEPTPPATEAPAATEAAPPTETPPAEPPEQELPPSAGEQETTPAAPSP